MKFSRTIALVCAGLLAVTMLAGCSDEKNTQDDNTVSQSSAGLLVNPGANVDIGVEISDEAKAVCGNWAYIHDKETCVLSLSENGIARYNNVNYIFNSDGEFITLTDDEGVAETFRYQMNGDQMLFYITSDYTYTGGGEPDGLVGSWANKSKKYTFEFTGNGTFFEDAIFPGNYTVNKDASSIKLMYNDQFSDTVCYYKLDGKKLILEYPWTMVRM